MGLRSNWVGGASRFALIAVALSLASVSFAQIQNLGFPARVFQKTTKQLPNARVELKSLGTISTYSFYPPIDESIGQKGIRPRPREADRTLPIGPPNSLKAGGVTGEATARVGARFPGIQATGLIPPDCSSSVGLNHIVQTVNSRIAFYDKTTGLPTFLQNSTTFFQGLEDVVSFQFDPRTVYDQYNDRFILLFLALDEDSSTSQTLIAVSDDGDPNGNWNRFLLDTSVDVGGADSWLDYPMIGHTAEALVIAGNMFEFGGSFTSIQAFVINLADLYANNGVTASSFTLTGLGFNLQPGETYTPGGTTIYGISLNSSTSVRLWAFTDVGTPTPAAASIVIAVQGYQTAAPAPSGPITFGNDSLSGRTMDAGSRGTRFYATHTVQLVGQSKSSVRWYEFEMGTWPTAGSPSLVQQGNITLPGNHWAYMPAIAKNQDDSFSVIYTRSSPTIVSDLVISSRSSFDAAGTMSPPTLIKSGAAPNPFFRWGDYFTVVVDPVDDRTFWGHGMITRSDGNWATEITSWTVPRITTTEYDATSISTTQGTPTGGGLPQILAQDDAYYTVDSVLVPGVGYFGFNEINFTISETPSLVRRILITVEASSLPTETVTGTLYLWNWNASQFEYANAFSIKSTDNVFTANMTSNLTRYINGSGQVRVGFRAHDPFRIEGSRPQTFSFRADYVHLQISHIVP